MKKSIFKIKEINLINNHLEIETTTGEILRFENAGIINLEFAKEIKIIRDFSKAQRMKFKYKFREINTEKKTIDSEVKIKSKVKTKTKIKRGII